MKFLHPWAGRTNLGDRSGKTCRRCKWQVGNSTLWQKEGEETRRLRYGLLVVTVQRYKQERLKTISENVTVKVSQKQNAAAVLRDVLWIEGRGSRFINFWDLPFSTLNSGWQLPFPALEVESFGTIHNKTFYLGHVRHSKTWNIRSLHQKLESMYQTLVYSCISNSIMGTENILVKWCLYIPGAILLRIVILILIQ